MKAVNRIWFRPDSMKTEHKFGGHVIYMPWGGHNTFADSIQKHRDRPITGTVLSETVFTGKYSGYPDLNPGDRILFSHNAVTPDMEIDEGKWDNETYHMQPGWLLGVTRGEEIQPVGRLMFAHIDEDEEKKTAAGIILLSDNKPKNRWATVLFMPIRPEWLPEGWGYEDIGPGSRILLNKNEYNKMEYEVAGRKVSDIDIKSIIGYESPSGFKLFGNRIRVSVHLTEKIGNLFVPTDALQRRMGKDVTKGTIVDCGPGCELSRGDTVVFNDILGETLDGHTLTMEYDAEYPNEDYVYGIAV